MKIERIRYLTDEEIARARPPGAIFPSLTLSTDELRVIHRALWTVGWWHPWGTSEHKSILAKLDTFFAADTEHLRSR